MPQIVRTETRKRGIFGKIVLILFWAFNAAMIAAVVIGLQGAGEAMTSMQTEAERGGAALGTALGTGFLLAVWFFGAAILGMMAAFTRGRVTVTETTRD